MTDINQASELYELCKEVYERTGWGFINEEFEDARNRLTSDNQIIYSSDYLLEKMPAYYEYWDGGNEAGYLRVRKWSADYEAGYWEDNATEETWQRPSRFTGGYANTPLKALLKLTIALSEAGELK